MAGIGDYVHARNLHYLKSGLSLYGDNSPPSAQSVYKMQITKIKEEAIRQKFKNPSKDKEKIERWLNMFFNPGMKNSIKEGTLTQENIDKIQEAIEKYIGKNFNGSVALNPKNLSASSSDIFDTEKASAELMDQINKFNSYWPANNRYVNGLKDRINALIQLRNQLGQKNFKDQTIWRELQGLEDDLKQLEKDVERYAEISGNTGATIGRFWMTKDANGEQLDKKLDRLIQLLKTNASSKIIGEYGELVVKASNFVINKKGNASIRQILKYLNDSLKNTSKSNKGVSNDFLSFYATYFKDSSSLYDSKGNEKDYTSLQGDQYTLNLTEDKVDATIDIDKNLRDINLSIKNYNLSNKSDITLLSGNNLLALVQEYTTFVNHFLNIVGTHEDEISGDSSDISLMHSAMKITAFLKAIAGGVITKQGRNDAVDLFVVNDNSKKVGYYKVYFLSDLLDKVIEDVKLISIKDYPEGVWMQNKWVESKQSGGKYDRAASAIRITNMINVMRNMALHVTISKKVLD